jgi:hypothetical protein
MIPSLDSISSLLMNVVPMPGTLTIIPISTNTAVPLPTGIPYVAMFNPENFSQQTTYTYNCEKAPGRSEFDSIQFTRVNQQDIQFEFIIDGTGASGEKRNVKNDLDSFRSVTGFNGERHMPNYLALIWGTFIFQGFLKSLDVQYTLFQPDGTPLRAKMRCAFKASTTSLLGLLTDGLFSPDLTHKHLVKANDRLDNLSQRYYESSRHHVSIARANNLTTLRKLNPSTYLFMPPLEK